MESIYPETGWDDVEVGHTFRNEGTVNVLDYSNTLRKNKSILMVSQELYESFKQRGLTSTSAGRGLACWDLKLGVWGKTGKAFQVGANSRCHSPEVRENSTLEELKEGHCVQMLSWNAIMDWFTRTKSWKALQFILWIFKIKTWHFKKLTPKMICYSSHWEAL